MLFVRYKIMGLILGVLEDERERLTEVILIYMDKIRAFPRGSLRLKSRNDKQYAYLAYREKDKVKFKYIAPVPSDVYDEVSLEIKKRKQYEDDLKEMKKDLLIINRTLKNARKER